MANRALALCFMCPFRVIGKAASESFAKSLRRDPTAMPNAGVQLQRSARQAATSPWAWCRAGAQPQGLERLPAATHVRGPLARLVARRAARAAGSARER